MEGNIDLKLFASEFISSSVFFGCDTSLCFLLVCITKGDKRCRKSYDYD